MTFSSFLRTSFSLLLGLLFGAFSPLYAQRDFAKHSASENSRGIALVVANQAYETGKLKGVVIMAKK